MEDIFRETSQDQFDAVLKPGQGRKVDKSWMADGLLIWHKVSEVASITESVDFAF